MVGLKSTSQKEQTFEKLPIPCLVEAASRCVRFALKVEIRKKVQFKEDTRIILVYAKIIYYTKVVLPTSITLFYFWSKLWR